MSETSGNSNIKFKRKETSGNPTSEAGKRLAAGEPFYNLADKHLYIGNKDDGGGEEIAGKKHISEITVSKDGECVVTVGEDEQNNVKFDYTTFKASTDDTITLDLSEIILDGGIIEDKDE
jgi:hypothetical protein